MCKKMIPIKIDDQLCDIDECMAPFVVMLNNNGYRTIACCCGHGKQPSTIVYHDDGLVNELRIMTAKQARKVDKLFPAIHKAIPHTLFPKNIGGYQPDPVNDEIEPSPPKEE